MRKLLLIPGFIALYIAEGLGLLPNRHGRSRPFTSTAEWVISGIIMAIILIYLLWPTSKRSRRTTPLSSPPHDTPTARTADTSPASTSSPPPPA